MDSSNDLITTHTVAGIHEVSHKSYIFVFMIVGLITLIPLIMISIAVLMKSRMSKLCRLLLVCACLSLGSIVSALAFIHYILGPIDMILAKGDQILIGEPSNTFLMNIHELRSITCNHLEIQSNKLRVRVWATTISPHYEAQQNYSLVLRNWSLPTFSSLRLNAGDHIHMHNFSKPVQIIMLKGQESFNKWSQTGSYKQGYEKCCSWYILQTNLDDRQDITIEQNDIYTLILRIITSSSTSDIVEKLEIESTPIITGYMDLFRTRWSPNPCDPVICDGRTTTLCKVTSSPKSYIIDYTVETMTAPNYDYASIRIVCYPRHWALGIMFSLPTMLIISLIIVINACIKRQKKQLKFSDTSIQRTPFKDLNVEQIKGKYTASNENYNPAFEFDLV